MMKKYMKLLFTCHLASVMAADDISILPPKNLIHSEPQIAKFSRDGEKLFIGFADEKINNSIAYDITTKSKIEHCTSK
jgi:hypothetical protein